MRPSPRVIGLAGLVAALALAPQLPTTHTLAAQGAAPPARTVSTRAPDPPVEVDRTGVMRWTANGREVALFGVNYAAPFAYDYQAMKSLGVDIKRAIDADVYHLSRLGVDAYRIHVWDREVTDSLGNLLENEHLDLFDYLLAELAKRGIKVLLTPIAWWGPGYPAPDHPSPGFANRYSKPQMLVDSVARRASVRYVAQFVAHVNPYTRLSYRDDPNIIAFEVFNEPWHDLAPPHETTRYIDEMVRSMRSTGLRKPVFYNISEHYTPAHGEAVCAADIQGVSAQWYPTGLVRGEMLPGNPLPNVDKYPLPWKDFAGCKDKALMVYEFDGADVNIPVMYPAMARAFRGAGFQWATQFAYDPMAIAYSNTEYQTHFLNLAYSPAKAISFLIAGEVFRRTARGFDAGAYPASERFGGFRISYAEQMSEYVSDSVFVHAGSTTTRPPRPERLGRLAGVGSSALVTYAGTGAWFLDRVARGMWRLEVMPDVDPVEDPHSRGSLQRAVARIAHRTQVMRVDLPDLGAEFVAVPANATTTHRPTVRERTFEVRPGVYMLLTPEAHAAMGRDAGPWSNERIAEYFAPAPTGGPTVVRHTPPTSIPVNGRHLAEFEIHTETRPDSVVLAMRQSGWQGYARIRLNESGLTSRTRYSQDLVASNGTGRMEYIITLHEGARATTYPGAAEGRPGRWDFTGTQHWSVPVVPAEAPIVLFDGDRDRSRVVDPGYIPGVRWRSEVIAASQPERNAWAFSVDSFGPTAQHVGARTMLRESTRARLVTPASVSHDRVRLRLRLRAPLGAATPLQVAVILTDGSAWGTGITVQGQWSEVDVPLRALRQVPLVLLPRPYPTFLPYDLTVGTAAPGVAIQEIEGIQWGFARAPGAPPNAATRIEVEWVQLVFTP